MPSATAHTPCSPLTTGILHAARAATFAFRTTGTHFSLDSFKNSLRVGQLGSDRHGQSSEGTA